jgi:hypothetical protein
MARDALAESLQLLRNLCRVRVVVSKLAWHSRTLSASLGRKEVISSL